MAKDKHEALCEAASKAVENLMSDRTVSLADTLLAMECLSDEVDVNILSLREDVERQGEE